MSAKSARREYLQAVGEFQRGCEAFAVGMQQILEDVPRAAGASGTPSGILAPLGPRKPAIRALQRAPSVAPNRTRSA